MTSSRLRRLTRNALKSEIYKELSDSESQSEGEESDYEIVAAPRPIKRSKNSKAGPPTKRARVPRGKNVNLDQLEAGLPENYLYQALAQPDIDTQDLALEWIESYTEDEEEAKNTSLTILINLLLRSCGSVYLFEAHDLVNLESAAETVGELTILFGNQKSHRYPFKALPAFKSNVLSFFEDLIKIAHEKGSLYKYNKDDQEEDDADTYLASPLMNQILTWISSLSTCTIRPLRFIATLILLSIQNQLCHIINSVVINLEKSQRQLTRANQKNKSKIQTISRAVQSYQNQKDTILEYFSEIGDITLGHRYRDIDPVIRQECIKYLGQAMMIFPDHFFQPTFLRFYGWLLSDPSSLVRIEVTKVLLRLYKNFTGSGKSSSNNLNIGFRQFTERYKEQLIKMNKLDSDVNVRFNTLSICCELLKIGFLNDSECYDIISIFFSVNGGDDFYSRTMSKTNYNKFKTEIAKFVTILNDLKLKERLEKYARILDSYLSPQFDEGDVLSLKSCLRLKELIDILQNCADHYKENLLPEVQDTFLLKKQISAVFESVYATPTFDNTWEVLIKYLTLDIQLVVFIPQDDQLNENNIDIDQLKNALDLSEAKDKDYLLYFVDGSIGSIISRKGPELSNILTKLVNYVPTLQSLVKSKERLSIFLSIWYKLVQSNEAASNIITSFNELGHLQQYNDITIKLLKEYQAFTFTANETNSEVLSEYELLFAKLFESYDQVVTTGLSIRTPEIKIQVQNTIEELVGELKVIFKTSRLDNASTDNELGTQKRVLQTITEVLVPFSKLQKLGDFIDLNEYLNTSSTSQDLSVFSSTVHTMRIFKVQVFLQSWTQNFLQASPRLIQSFRAVLDLFLITTSWNLEKIIALEDECLQANYDIAFLFQRLNELIPVLVGILEDSKHLIEFIIDQDLKSRYFLIKTINEIRTLVAAKLIDFITSIKVLYVKFKSKNAFKNFDDFFGNKNGIGFLYVVRLIPEELQNQLLDLFLYKEAQLGRVLEIELDRNDIENVNIEDLFLGEEEGSPESEEEALQRSVFDSDDESDIEGSENKQLVQQQRLRNQELKQKDAKQKKVWGLEKELCVYTLKMFALIDMSIIEEKIDTRVQLNSDKIGGVFARLVKQHSAQDGGPSGGTVPQVRVAPNAHTEDANHQRLQESPEPEEQIQDPETELATDLPPAELEPVQAGSP
ncbi:uncharacterized protein CANTADRAFT_7347 [Suhomyces tanzawaensis NRRL Y-17324]|uniref:SCD domain-containing protein n=1 Tax=Suhomyces tanzawaensis NRRL Y-17324 TaxID=984487 RepID=A0A1E4SEH5_9ASCO|nr:uncharacterized protein CANTADRAFT_7347 [Suhomyces tanzawaensis NRRL Y-17324]ODV77866.1 hypothetical protein CANTADRAFT_7347 [Suhomyces tanzawaensis NRRL Y-17324]